MSQLHCLVRPYRLLCLTSRSGRHRPPTHSQTHQGHRTCAQEGCVCPILLPEPPSYNESQHPAPCSNSSGRSWDKTPTPQHVREALRICAPVGVCLADLVPWCVAARPPHGAHSCLGASRLRPSRPAWSPLQPCHSGGRPPVSAASTSPEVGCPVRCTPSPCPPQPPAVSATPGSTSVLHLPHGCAPTCPSRQCTGLIHTRCLLLTPTVRAGDEKTVQEELLPPCKKASLSCKDYILLVIHH